MSNCKPCQLSSPEILAQLPVDEACAVEIIDPLYGSGSCLVDKDGYPIITPETPEGGAVGGCVIGPTGLICPPNEDCSPFDLTESDEACLISDVIAEQLDIGGAVLNVHRLLGVHEQGLLQDLVGNGEAISNGSHPNFPAKNAFDKYITEWRSLQTGTDVLKSAYIGYDFGPIRLDNTRVRYGIETAIKHDVSMFSFKQGCHSINRVTKVRVERSNDGEKWYGVTVLNVSDCEGMVKLAFNKSVPSRYWRLRPAAFNGGPDDPWVVQALQLVDYERTHITNVQDRIWMENRDRDYDENIIRMKCAYTPIDIISNQAKYGFMQDMDSYSLEVSFAQTVAKLGRPFVIGDIVELPSETQYRPDLSAVKKYLEITDVAWSVNGFTPTWVPTMQRLMARPALASQETQQIFGKLTPNIDTSGLMDLDDGRAKKYQDYSAVSQTIKADANTMVPERGEDRADIQRFSDELLKFSDDHPNMNLRKFDRNRNLYGIDALPPNGLPFTEGDDYPTNPVDGAYHRLSYTKVGKNIPVRLMRYSAAKGYWLYLETDRRYETNNTKPIIQEFLNPETSTVTPIDKVDDFI